MDSQLLLGMILERSRSVQWGVASVCILQPVEILGTAGPGSSPTPHPFTVK